VIANLPAINLLIAYPVPSLKFVPNVKIITILILQINADLNAI